MHFVGLLKFYTKSFWADCERNAASNFGAQKKFQFQVETPQTASVQAFKLNLDSPVPARLK